MRTCGCKTAGHRSWRLKAFLACLFALPLSALAQESLPAGTPSTEVNPRNKKVIRWGLSAPAAGKSAANSSKNDAPALRTEGKPTAKPAENPVPNQPASKKSIGVSAKLVFENLTLRDEDGRIVYRGTVDLKPTLERISQGRYLSHRNDGSEFRNREGRIPRRVTGYYREWVVPAPDVRGPGPMRLVTGANGEVFFTYDHYKSFQRIK